MFKKDLDRELEAGKTLNVAVMDALKPMIASVLDVVCFDGNGYADEWKAEAVKRGLDTETNVPKMVSVFTRESSVNMFTETKVFSRSEIDARNDVKWDTYCKKVQIESRVMVRMATNHIIPAVLEYKTRLLKELALHKDVFGHTDGCAAELGLISEISKYVDDIRVKAAEMQEMRRKANAIADDYQRALAYHEVAEAIYALREPIDSLEEIVDNRLWPLPKYRELLFIS